MKKIIVVALVLAALGTAGFGAVVELTGAIAADFLKSPSAQEIIDTFFNADQPFFWGPGWEVVFSRVGIGGAYLVNFFRDSSSQWWLDWYGQAFFLSYHAFGSTAFLDPFLQVGVGSAGRVFLGDWIGAANSNLYLSIFPFLTVGLALDLDGFLLGAKATYTPFQTPPPVTDFTNYPLGNFQVALFAGIVLGY